MGRRIRLKRGVIWYPLEEFLWVLVSPSSEAPEKCRLMNRGDVALLDLFKNAASVDEEEIPPHAMTVVKKWLSPEFPVLEEVMKPRPLEDYEHLAAAIHQEYMSAKNLEGYHDLGPYYRRKILDPFRQFDKIETTVSHLYREGHPALGGKSYGEKFAQVLLQEEAIREGASILEVGCGTGLFGMALLSEVKKSAPTLYKTLHYTFFDLSPAMTESQRRLNKKHQKVVSFFQGDAVACDFAGKAYDLIICNEMIADLPVIKLNRKKSRKKGAEGEAWDLARNLGLEFSDAPPHFVLNLGALRFLSSLSRALKPGGKAYIVEYGSPHGYPVGHFITDHTEYSIHFGHLLRAASVLGLGGKLRALSDFLGFDPTLEVLDSFSHAALFSHLLPFLGIEADVQRVYTKSLLIKSLPKSVPKIQNLSFVALRSLKGIAYPDGFHVLQLLKSPG
jgi:ubiquinone/menaquinone biosynthesis C-methylase UbiE